MGERTDGKSPFTLPSIQEQLIYQNTKRLEDGPSIDTKSPKDHPFKFDPSRRVTTVWNVRCVDLFVHHYLMVGNALSRDPKVIRKAIITHHKALSLQWLKHHAANLAESVVKKLAITAARQGRHSRRVEVCHIHHQL